MSETASPPRILSIAGSDSSGGAGIQADIKTVTMLGGYAMTAITAVTAQNTQGVAAIHEVPTDVITAQIQAVISDIEVDAVKTGMLASSSIIQCVASELERRPVPWLVVDPVMVAKSGDALLWEDAVDALKTLLVPLASVITPNIPEAEALTGKKIESDTQVREAAEAFITMGAKSVVVKGGHREGPATDLFFDGTTFHEFTSPRIETANTHGTGCTFASAVAAGLARGMSILEAVGLAKEFVTEAILSSFPVGQGHGPLNHFHKLWK